MPAQHFAYALPSVCHTAAEIAALTGADEQFIIEKVGLSRRYVLGPGETGVSLAADACRKLFDRHSGLAEEVDTLIFVTQTPDRRLPQNSAGLAAVLNLPDSLASFDLSLGCSGFVYALSVAEGFLHSVGRHCALVVTCDPYSRIIDPSDKDTNCVFGDAATATVVRLGQGRGRILATDFGTRGQDGDSICVPAGGAARPLVGAIGAEPAADISDDLRLHMHGRSVFNFVNSVVPESIRACLGKAGLKLDDIDLFALHQGSRYMLDAMARRVGIPPQKLLQNISNYGNTVSSSIPLLLSEQDEAGHLNGRLVLVSGFGVGLSWATAILQF